MEKQTSLCQWPPTSSTRLSYCSKNREQRTKEEKNKFREKRINNCSSRARETIALTVRRLGCHPFVVRRDARSWSTGHLPRFSQLSKKKRRRKSEASLFMKPESCDVYSCSSPIGSHLGTSWAAIASSLA